MLRGRPGARAPAPCVAPRGLLPLGLVLAVTACSSSPEPVSAGAPLVCPAPRQTSSTFPADLGAEIAALLESTLLDAKAPGVGVVVALPDGARWYGAAGLADVRTREALAPGHGHRIGSITKTFTTAVVLQLVDEGRLTLDDPLDQHVPGFALGPEVTLRRLLEHTAGVYNYTADGAFLARGQTPATPQEVIEFALGHEPPGPPGGQYLYSNTGFFLLGLVIEAVEGRPYHQVVRERLLHPHGLDTVYLDELEPPPGCPPSNGHMIGGVDDDIPFSMTWGWAAGGLVADPGQLCDWGELLYRSDEVVPAALGEALVTPSALSVAAGSPYGLGTALPERGGRTVVGHTGSTMGFNGELFLDRDTGLCVAVQTNDFSGRHEAVSEPLWELLAGRGY